jgi:hypothetical protein
MLAILVDPDLRSVEYLDLGEGDFLANLRAAIAAPQITCVSFAEGRLTIWVDNLGMIKPGRNFWKFEEFPAALAGKAVITGLDLSGRPRSVPEVPLDEVKEGIVWIPSEALLRIDEELTVAEGPEGRPIPLVVRTPIWQNEPTEQKADEPSVREEMGLGGWSVYRRAVGGYRAIRFSLEEGTLKPSAMFTAPSLEEVRERLPGGLERVEPLDEDDEDLVESWVE